MKIFLIVLTLFVSSCSLQEREFEFPKSPCACKPLKWSENNVLQS